ncbi:ribosome small subunit-dependent GTPase A [Nocardia sp. NPDC057227]|uniref:ribosome small subunit-dependent GTPase A n=1 Tax=Nocardia sp. NPDC057227 TaxID=3346056 RepID=UPI003633A08B
MGAHARPGTGRTGRTALSRQNRSAGSSYDESDVRIRPGGRSRPRTKTRPLHSDAEQAMVVAVDRGRWGCVLAGDPERRLVAMRARELGRTPIVVGDLVDVVGDLSGAPDTLARIVRVTERSTVLRRTADDTDPFERIVVANAEQLFIVVALADPPPRTGFVERTMVAAFVGGLQPVLCLTKDDLAAESDFATDFADLDLIIVHGGIEDPLQPVLDRITGRLTAFIGHSGVGKSTLVNRLVPDAFRAVGEVSGVGKGKHTSTQSVALPVPSGGWVIDTPGVRSFGLAHITPDDVIAAFSDLADAIEDCPRGCTHLGPPADPECALDELPGKERRVAAIRRLLVALNSNDPW